MARSAKEYDDIIKQLRDEVQRTQYTLENCTEAAKRYTRLREEHVCILNEDGATYLSDTALDAYVDTLLPKSRSGIFKALLPELEKHFGMAYKELHP